ncbi:MAG TPA: DUF116 domain-containing protein [bacterium]|nr:DUF116 domain-containing protein [bacterium]
MKKRKRRTFITIQDRKLGDEWTSWGGDLSACEANASTGKRVFMGILLLVIIMLGLVGFLTWYMISPRLAQLHPRLPVVTAIMGLSLWTLAAGWFFLISLSLMIEKDVILHLGHRRFSITFLVPLVLKLGIRLGVPKDRLGNSFVKVSNSLIRFRAPVVQPEQLLILLPRCLKKNLIETIITFSKSRSIPVYTVAGGTKARELIQKLRPRAIIGVACERDLLSAIQDVIQRIPVIGIPNSRPQGPCKDTVIELSELEFALQIFLGERVRLRSFGFEFRQDPAPSLSNKAV